MAAVRRDWLALVTGLLLGLVSCADSPATPPATNASPATAPPTERVVGPITEGESQALATMNDRLAQYIQVHQALERSLPTLPNEATPEQIDRHQRAFEKRMRQTRSTARRGDIFTPQAEPVIRKLLATVFGGPDGKELKASIMEENPSGHITLAVNGRYPDDVPISTIPPQVLQTLPRLTEGLEYRFIGDSLILLDVHAHVIADFIEDALPK